MSAVSVRHSGETDLPALLDIYNYYVLNTPITFDIQPRSLGQRLEWLAQFANTGRYQCFVAERDGDVVGWACSTLFKERESYATSIETSVYCAPGHTGRHIGRQLYGALFGALQGEDVHRAYGGITLPNEASVALHLATGFRHIGTYTEVGRKFGRFWDVALYQREMG